MSERRVPEETRRKIDAIKGVSDVKGALEEIVDLFENYTHYEEKVPVRYDPETGKPVKFEWKPSKSNGQFERRIALRNKKDYYDEAGDEGYVTSPDEAGPVLSREAVKFIKNNSPILLRKGSVNYVFKYERHSYSFQEQGGGTVSGVDRVISVGNLTEL